MPNPELMRIVDGIARDKNIEKEQIYTDIEQAWLRVYASISTRKIPANLP